MVKKTSLKAILSGKPSTVKTAKKKTKKAKPPLDAEIMDTQIPKRVSIEKAGNGFSVSDHMGGNTMVAKSMAECVKHVKGMMGGK